MPSPIPNRHAAPHWPEPPPVNDGRLRFSLQTMFAIVTIGSTMLAPVVAFPGAWAVGALLVMLQIVPLTLLFGVIWGRRYQRAFSLGALVPAAVTLLALAPTWISAVFMNVWHDNALTVAQNIVVRMEGYHGAFRIIAVSSWSCSLLLGLIAFALRRWVFRGDA